MYQYVSICINMYQYVSICINMYQYVSIWFIYTLYQNISHICWTTHITMLNLCCGMPRVLRRNTQRHATVRLLEDSQPSCQGRGREYDADIEQIWQIGYIWIIHLCKIIVRNFDIRNSNNYCRRLPKNIAVSSFFRRFSLRILGSYFVFAVSSGFFRCSLGFCTVSTPENTCKGRKIGRKTCRQQ